MHEHGPSPHHTAGVMYRNGSVLAIGPSGQLQTIPQGHVSSFIVVGTRGQVPSRHPHATLTQSSLNPSSILILSSSNSHSILAQPSPQGIHGAMRHWGATIRTKYKTVRNTEGDLVTNKLGLWTDNGALGS